MLRIRAALARIAKGLSLNRPLLARARRRYKANRKRAFVAHAKQIKVQERADRLVRYEPEKAEALTKRALRYGHIAYKNHLRAQFWLGRIKVLLRRVEGLESDQTSREAGLKKLYNVTIKGNEAKGGTPKERLKAVALKSASECAAGRRPNFYSQVGLWDVGHCITGERYGERSDCSSWFTSVYKSAGLKDPNGQGYSGGYTGTLVANGKQIPQPEIGCAVIYGAGTGHHVEMWIGPGNRTIGHGSAPVDSGVIDLFGDGDYRFFAYSR